MSKCSFSIPYSGSAEALVARATTAITRAGGDFNGNISEGNFALQTFMGQIAGSYTTTKEELNIEITTKPVFVPCSEIENQLRKYIG